MAGVPTDELTIVFADIVGSSRLYTQLGDTKAEAVVNQALAAQGQMCRNESGTVIKTIGDASLSCFAQPLQAVRAAVAIHHFFDMRPIGDTGIMLSMKIGLHHGAAVRRDGDVFGDAVNVAARLADLCRPRQILTTATTVAALGDCEIGSRLLDRVELRGRPGLVGLAEIVWESTNLTQLAEPGMVTANLTAYTLVMSRGAERKLLASGGGATIGRDPQCDFTVDNPKSSRLHVKVECRGGNFFATDNSSNGTLVECEGQQRFIRRESVQLSGSGWISAGGRMLLPEAERVQFRLAQGLRTGEETQPADPEAA